MPEWIKRDLGQMVSGLIQAIAFVAVGSWYLSSQLYEIDRRALLQQERIDRMQERVAQVENSSALYRGEVLDEVRRWRTELRADLNRLEDKLDARIKGRTP